MFITLKRDRAIYKAFVEPGVSVLDAEFVKLELVNYPRPRASALDFDARGRTLYWFDQDSSQIVVHRENGLFVRILYAEVVNGGCKYF